MIGEYRHGRSFLHSLPAGAKLAGLVLSGTAIFLVSDLRMLAGMLAATLLLYKAAGMALREAARPLRSAALLLLVIFAAQAALNTWEQALTVVLRFVILITLANLVTLTTTVSAVMERLSAWLAPLARVGVNPIKISLAVSLAIRFIPLLMTIGSEVRDAQRARGLERNILAMALPLIVRTLRMADEIAEAIEARGFDPETARKNGQATALPTAASSSTAPAPIRNLSA